MRSFAKICTEIPDDGEIAKKLEGLLNTEVAIMDSEKEQVFQPRQKMNNDEESKTVHPNIISQADFQFLPAGMKIARIEEYERMKYELRKTREVREML